ncbi:MAG: hypothetical protein JWL72_266 [Ilumatobacteraceae bacterium]|nr:hypothetical protein [Ilumatobacteraceae bacterium]
MFGNADKREAGVTELRDQTNRLASLPLAALGAEIMTTVFGPQGPGGNGSFMTDVTTANAFISDTAAWSDEDAVRQQLIAVISEGLQVLEHACLIRAQVIRITDVSIGLGWMLTRSGAAALAQGRVVEAIS